MNENGQEVQLDQTTVIDLEQGVAPELVELPTSNPPELTVEPKKPSKPKYHIKISSRPSYTVNDFRQQIATVLFRRTDSYLKNKWLPTVCPDKSTPVTIDNRGAAFNVFSLTKSSQMSSSPNSVARYDTISMAVPYLPIEEFSFKDFKTELKARTSLRFFQPITDVELIKEDLGFYPDLSTPYLYVRMADSTSKVDLNNGIGLLLYFPSWTPIKVATSSRVRPGVYNNSYTYPAQNSAWFSYGEYSYLYRRAAEIHDVIFKDGIYSLSVKDMDTGEEIARVGECDSQSYRASTGMDNTFIGTGEFCKETLFKYYMGSQVFCKKFLGIREDLSVIDPEEPKILTEFREYVAKTIPLENVANTSSVMRTPRNQDSGFNPLEIKIVKSGHYLKKIVESRFNQLVALIDESGIDKSLLGRVEIGCGNLTSEALMKNTAQGLFRKLYSGYLVA